MDHDEMLLCGNETALAFSQELTAATIALPNPTEKLTEPTYELVTNAFALWVKRIPQQIAVRQGDYSWTYSELASSAHTLA